MSDIGKDDIEGMELTLAPFMPRSPVNRELAALAAWDYALTRLNEWIDEGNATIGRGHGFRVLSPREFVAAKRRELGLEGIGQTARDALAALKGDERG